MQINTMFVCKFIALTILYVVGKEKKGMSIALYGFLIGLIAII